MINPAPAVPKTAPPIAETTPVIAQSDFIVWANDKFACTQLFNCVCTSDVTFVKYPNLYLVITFP